MSPANQAKLDELKAQLPARSRAADLWDTMGPDERQVQRAKFARSCKRGARQSLPVNTRHAYDLQSWRAQQAIDEMLRPIIRDSEAIARRGSVVGV